MAAMTHDLDLAGLRLSPGEGRTLDLRVPIGALEMGGERYEADPASAPVRLDVSRMTGGGYALKLKLRARLSGPCMRCLKDATPEIEVNAREVEVPGEDEELRSPYMRGETLDLAAWVHDAFTLAAPAEGAVRFGVPGAVSGVRARPERGRPRASA